MTHFTLYVLGPPRLERDGSPVTVPRRKVMALLVYLALTPEGCSRDTLAGLLWPDDDQGSARADLRRAALRPARHLGGAGSSRRRGSGRRGAVGAALGGAVPPLGGCPRVPPLPAQGIAETERPATPTPERLAALARATQLYHGDLLSGFSLDDSPPFEEWQLVQAERLRSELRGALEQLALGHLRRGDESSGPRPCPALGGAGAGGRGRPSRANADLRRQRGAQRGPGPIRGLPQPAPARTGRRARG